MFSSFAHPPQKSIYIKVKGCLNRGSEAEVFSLGECFSPVSISHIQSPSGEILMEPVHINARFASYYQELYSSQVQYTEQKLCMYLDTVDLRCLTDWTR